MTQWQHIMKPENIFARVTPQTLEQYQNYLLWQKRLSPRTIQRQTSSLKRFFSFLEKENYISKSPFRATDKQFPQPFISPPSSYQAASAEIPRPIDKFLGIKQSFPPQKAAATHTGAVTTSTAAATATSEPAGLINKIYSLVETKRPGWYQRYHQNVIVHYLHFAIFIIILSSVGYGIYDQFFKVTPSPLAYPPATTNIAPPRVITFQGKLMDKLNNPIVKPSLVSFRLWNAAENGSLLYNSGACIIKPDINGIFTTNIGRDCGPPIPARIFSENSRVFIGITVGNDSEMKPRHQIPTTAYALNTETLQGHPPSASAAANQIPVISESGDLVIAAPNPRIYSTSGTFQLRGQALSIITDTGTDGDITISPDGKGKLNLVFGGVSGKQVNATAANLGSNGTLYYGGVTNDSTSCRLLQLQSGTTILSSSYLTDRLVVDCAGNLELANKLQVAGNLSSTIAYSRLGNQESNRGLSNPQDLLISGSLEVDNPAFFDSTTAVMDKLGIRKTNPTYELDVGGDIGLDQYIFHNDDSDTYLNFTEDSLQISVGGAGFLQLSEGDDPDTLIGNYNNANIDFRWDGDSNDSLLFIDASSERVGIGTSSPSQKLEVNGDIRLDASGTATTNGLCHSGANSDTTFSDRDIVACSAAPGDIAEWYDTKDGQPGDIMVTTDQTVTYDAPVVNALTGEILNEKQSLTVSLLEKANKPYQSNIIGIISTSPFQSMGRAILDYAKNPNPIAVVGRTAVKVSTINGAIFPGDPITSSVIAGVGMKATNPGVIVGKALESFFCQDFPCRTDKEILYWVNQEGDKIEDPQNYQKEKYPVAKIQVFVNIGWHHPSWQLTDKGDLQTNKAYLPAPPPRQKDKPESTPETVAQDNITPKIKKLAETDSIATKTANTSALGIKRLLAKINQQSPLTSTTSSSSSSWNITSSPWPLTPLDSADIDLPENVFYDLTVLGQTSLGKTFIHGSLFTSGLVLEENSINSFRDSLKLQASASFPIEIMAGKIAINTNGDLIIEGNLLARGGITTDLIRPIPEGDIIIDLAAANDTASSEDREASPSGFRKSRFGRLLVRGADYLTVASIDDQGNASFEGNLTAGQISTNNLTANSLDTETIYTDNLMLKTATNSATIIAAAEVASRSGILATGIETNATTGEAVLPAQQTDLVIFTPHVTKDSFVYLTPLSPTENKVLYVAGKKRATESSKGYIHIAVDKPISHDVKFNWWIINQI